MVQTQLKSFVLWMKPFSGPWRPQLPGWRLLCVNHLQRLRVTLHKQTCCWVVISLWDWRLLSIARPSPAWKSTSQIVWDWTSSSHRPLCFPSRPGWPSAAAHWRLDLCLLFFPGSFPVQILSALKFRPFENTSCLAVLRSFGLILL